MDNISNKTNFTIKLRLSTLQYLGHKFLLQMNFNVILIWLETRLKERIYNSFNLKLYEPSYDILNWAQHSGTKQKPLGDIEFCKNHNLVHTASN